jgi:hypothetical protein
MGVIGEVSRLESEGIGHCARPNKGATLTTTTFGYDTRYLSDLSM